MDRTYREEDIAAVAQEILESLIVSDEMATVLALQGDLGAGKTTLTKAIARSLGVEDTVVSPTFVIAKFYNPGQRFETLIHIDAYRIESNDELQPLGWQHLVQQRNTLIVVEWPERIAAAMPDNAQYFQISHDGDQRSIKKL